MGRMRAFIELNLFFPFGCDQLSSRLPALGGLKLLRSSQSSVSSNISDVPESTHYRKEIMFTVLEWCCQHMKDAATHHEAYHSHEAYAQMQAGRLHSKAQNAPEALILCLLRFVFGGLKCGMQLLDLDVLEGQLLALLQKLFLELVHLMGLAGCLTGSTAFRPCLLAA